MGATADADEVGATCITSWIACARTRVGQTIGYPIRFRRRRYGEAMTDESEQVGGSSDVVADLRNWLGSPAFEQWLKGDSDTARQVLQVFSVVVEGARALGEKLAPFVQSGGLERLAQSIANGNRWINEAPQKLKDALASEGWSRTMALTSA